MNPDTSLAFTPPLDDRRVARYHITAVISYSYYVPVQSQATTSNHLLFKRLLSKLDPNYVNYFKWSHSPCHAMPCHAESGSSRPLDIRAHAQCNHRLSRDLESLQSLAVCTSDRSLSRRRRWLLLARSTLCRCSLRHWPSTVLRRSRRRRRRRSRCPRRRHRHRLRLHTGATQLPYPPPLRSPRVLCVSLLRDLFIVSSPSSILPRREEGRGE